MSALRPLFPLLVLYLASQLEPAVSLSSSSSSSPQVYRRPSQPLLSAPCTSTTTCQNRTTFSQCYAGQCICSFGYQLSLDGQSCIKVNCIFNSECAQLFPNAVCHNTGTCVCDFFHALDRPSQTCTDANLLNVGIFVVFASFLFCSIFVICAIFFSVTILEWIFTWRRRQQYERMQPMN